MFVYLFVCCVFVAGDLFQLLSYEEVQKKDLKVYKPVEPWEYNLTPEEEEEALRGVEEGEDGSEPEGSDADSNSSDDGEAAGAGESKGSVDGGDSQEDGVDSDELRAQVRVAFASSPMRNVSLHLSPSFSHSLFVLCPCACLSRMRNRQSQRQ